MRNITGWGWGQWLAYLIGVIAFRWMIAEFGVDAMLAVVGATVLVMQLPDYSKAKP